MDFTFNEEQSLIQDQVDQFIQKEYDWETRQSLSNSDLGFGQDNWQKFAELGWLGLQIPDDFGGLGLGFLDLCVVLEESGRALMPEPFVSTLLLATQTLLLGGNQAQQQALLSGIASGDKIVSLGFEETGCRDPLSEMRTIDTRPSNSQNVPVRGRRSTHEACDPKSVALVGARPRLARPSGVGATGPLNSRPCFATSRSTSTARRSGRRGPLASTRTAATRPQSTKRSACDSHDHV